MGIAKCGWYVGRGERYELGKGGDVRKGLSGGGTGGRGESVRGDLLECRWQVRRDPWERVGAVFVGV